MSEQTYETRMTLLILKNYTENKVQLVRNGDTYFFDNPPAAAKAGEAMLGTGLWGAFSTMSAEAFIDMQISKLGATEALDMQDKYGSKCAARAKDQPHFILLAQDDLAPDLVNDWIERAQEQGTPVDKLDRARMYLVDIMEWRNLYPNKCKLPA